MQVFEKKKAITLLLLSSIVFVTDILFTPNDTWWLWIDKVSCLITAVIAMMALARHKLFEPRLYVLPFFGLIFYALVYTIYSPGYSFYMLTQLASAYVLILNVFNLNKTNVTALVSTFGILMLINAYYQGETLEYYQTNRQTYIIANLITIGVFILAGTFALTLTLRLFSIISDEKEKANSRLSFQNDLFSIIAHNFRTPLANIYSRIEISDLKNEAIQANEIRPSVEQLKFITENIIDQHRAIQSNELHSLATICSNLAKQFKPALRINKKLNGDVKVNYALQLALENFISNPVNIGSTVLLQIEQFHKDVTFRIIDKAGGFTHEKLFSLGAPLTSNTGLGIGIYLSLENLKYLGYHCFVGSTPDEGSEIIISTRPCQTMKSYELNRDLIHYD